MSWINQVDISQYLKEIRKIPTLSEGEEKILLKRTKNGDKKAIHELIVKNLRFVIKIAKEYQHMGILNLNDLISEGNLGLIKAAHKFDNEREVRFISYAVFWIRQTIIESLNNNSRLIRLPVNLLSELKKDRDSLTHEEYMNISYKKGCVIIENIEDEINDHGDTYLDIIVNEDAINPLKELEREVNLKTKMLDTMEFLNKRERIIIKLYYGLDGEELNLEQISNVLPKMIGGKEMSKERVRQIKDKAIQKMRYNSENLFYFFES